VRHENVTVTPDGYHFRHRINNLNFTSPDELLVWFKTNALTKPPAAAPAPAPAPGARYHAPPPVRSHGYAPVYVMRGARMPKRITSG